MLSWNPETLAVTLPIMLKGMVGIFAVIIVIWGFVALLNRIAGKKESRRLPARLRLRLTCRFSPDSGLFCSTRRSVGCQRAHLRVCLAQGESHRAGCPAGKKRRVP